MTPEELDEARAKEVLREFDEAGVYFTFLEVAIMAARLARENWTPPEPEVDPDVDPDVLAFREWIMEREPDMREQPYGYDADFWDNCLSARAFLAGARMAREQERERAKVLVECLDNLRQFSGWADGQRAAQTLAKYRGEA